ncbi:MAG: hypothetical protein JWP87_1031 [Labilithrix sp.]|nr:hypothetical protein [Labilithrix sp.]
MRRWLAVVVLFAAAVHAPQVARADDRARFALDLSGVRYGLVRASVEGEKTLVIGAQDIAPALVTLVDTFAQGKPVRRDARLTSGAVVRKANDARLTAVKLPSLGSGGATDVELAFAVSAVTTQPLLSAKEAPAQPAGARISTFRIDLSAMQAIEAPKLDAITVTQKPDGVATTGEIGIEVAAGGAPPFVAWQKKPAPRTLRIEYVGGDGAAILKLQLDRCTPSSVKPLGASGTTRITMTCGALRAG